jgi:hypothetical protein
MPAIAVKRRKTARKSATRAKTSKADVAASYNHHKFFGNKQYTGMQIGRSHSWHYDRGDWKETKITPDLWQIHYAVTKRRKGKAPKGSGVPVGTGYHWYIMAHQDVRKLNADDYSTELSGFKFKVAHMRAGKNKWSASAATQRKYLVGFLKEMITQLTQDPLELEFEYKEQSYHGEAVPVTQACMDGVCYEFEINLNGEYTGIIRRASSGWKMNESDDQKFIKAIGQQIEAVE